MQTTAYQGQPGAYSESAAQALVGTDATLVACQTIDDVIDALEQGRVTHAVIAIENSIAGAVPGSRSLVLHHNLAVLAEHDEPIDHVIAALPGAPLDDLRAVRSHPVALAQCSRFFESHPEITAVPTFDTAGAVDEIMRRGDPTEAALASRRAASLYGAVVLAEGVQDRDDNVTRFWLVSSKMRVPRS